MALDRIDLRILDLMQQDVSRTIAEIAADANLSRNACWRRIIRLETEGYVKKRVALLDPVKLGVGVTVFVTVRASEHTDQWLKSFSSVVNRIPEIVEFYRMSGEADYLLKIQVSDIAAYDDVYRRLIHGARLADVTSAFAMEEIKRTTAIPLPRQ